MASMTHQVTRSSESVTTDNRLPRTEDVLAEHLYHIVYGLLKEDDYKPILGYFVAHSCHLHNETAKFSCVNCPLSTHNEDNTYSFSKWWNSNEEVGIHGEKCGRDVVENPHLRCHLSDDYNFVTPSASSTYTQATFHQADKSENTETGLSQELSHNYSSNLETRNRMVINNECICKNSSLIESPSQVCNKLDAKCSINMTDDKMRLEQPFFDISETKHACIKTASSRSDVISSIIASLTAHITGMLLEPGQTDILLILLTDRDELKTRVDQALKCIRDGFGANNSEVMYEELCSSESPDKHTDSGDDGGGRGTADDMAQHLYHAVSEQEPQFAEKITGMILELDEEVLRDFLHNHNHLKQAVLKAKEALNGSPHRESGERETTTRPESLDEGGMDSISDDEMGEWLFKYLSSRYHEDAAKITGMLLEVDGKSLRHLVTHNELLLEKAEMAWKVLNNFKMGQAR